jgi:hypothetical protein
MSVGSQVRFVTDALRRIVRIYDDTRCFARTDVEDFRFTVIDPNNRAMTGVQWLHLRRLQSRNRAPLSALRIGDADYGGSSVSRTGSGTTQAVRFKL